MEVGGVPFCLGPGSILSLVLSQWSCPSSLWQQNSAYILAENFLPKGYYTYFSQAMALCVLGPQGVLSLHWQLKAILNRREVSVKLDRFFPILQQPLTIPSTPCYTKRDPLFISCPAPNLSLKHPTEEARKRRVWERWVVFCVSAIPKWCLRGCFITSAFW